MGQPPEQGKSSGGVSLFLRKVAGSRVIFKQSEKNFQLIIAQVGHIKIGAVYISPSATKEETEECLRMINMHARGREIVCGDWNARHKRWDRVSNRRGNQAVRWATAKRWKVSTLDDFSFRTKRYKSNIDFLATKNIEVRGIRSPEDLWTGHTQHRVVMTSFLTKESTTQPKHKISVKNWRDKEQNEKGPKKLQPNTSTTGATLDICQQAECT